MNNPVKYTDPSGNIFETGADMAFTAIDLGGLAKNFGEITWGSMKMMGNLINGDMEAWEANYAQQLKDIDEATSAGVGTGMNTVAVVVPGLPGGLNHIDDGAEAVAKHGDDVVDSAKKVFGANAKKGSKNNLPKSGSVTKKQREELYKKDGPDCVFCGVKTHNNKKSTPTKYEADHSIPRKMGGDNSMANLQVTCRNCNRSKGGKDSQSFINKITSSE